MFSASEGYFNVKNKKLSTNIKNILTNINFRAIIFNVKPKHIFYLEDQSNEKT